MTIVEPKAEFRSIDEATVMAALDDTNPDNSVAVEVARLMAGYMANFQSQVKRLGYIPSDVLHMKPRWPIEAVAMRLTSDAIHQSLASGTRG